MSACFLQVKTFNLKTTKFPVLVGPIFGHIGFFRPSFRAEYTCPKIGPSISPIAQPYFRAQCTRPYFWTHIKVSWNSGPNIGPEFSGPNFGPTELFSWLWPYFWVQFARPNYWNHNKISMDISPNFGPWYSGPIFGAITKFTISLALFLGPENQALFLEPWAVILEFSALLLGLKCQAQFLDTRIFKKC